MKNNFKKYENDTMIEKENRILILHNFILVPNKVKY